MIQNHRRGGACLAQTAQPAQFAHPTQLGVHHG